MPLLPYIDDTLWRFKIFARFPINVVLELRYAVLQLRFSRFSTGAKRNLNGLLDLSFCWTTIISIFSDFYLGCDCWIWNKLKAFETRLFPEA